MSTIKPVCPLMTSSPSYIAHCVGSGCALWDADGGRCAILSMAMLLAYFDRLIFKLEEVQGVEE